MRHWIVLLGLMGPACGTPAAEPEAGVEPAGNAPAEGTRLLVDNQSPYMMDIYLLRQGQRIPLGQAPSGERTRFMLTTSMLAGGGQMQFEAVPSRGIGQRVRSEQFPIRLTEELGWRIPPQ